MAEQLMKYSEAVKKFDPVIGLETHVELSTNTKLFCPAPISFGAEPNTELTPVSLGLPGSLPVINEAAVDYAIKLGLRAFALFKDKRMAYFFIFSMFLGVSLQITNGFANPFIISVPSFFTVTKELRKIFFVKN